MTEIKTQRRFQERFLDGFDRSQLRQEVQKVRPKKFKGLRKKYATWALGASLALGGIAGPMKVLHGHQGKAGGPQTGGASKPFEPEPIDRQIAGDIAAATQIANQVAGGVTAAATAPLAAVVEAPVKLAETVRQQFFHDEVPFGKIIYREAKKNDLPPELVAAVVQAESKFKPNARSQVGARGLMQLMPRTGRWMGARDLHDPAQNIMAGAKYLKYLNDRFNGNQENVLAAYNAGEGNVKRFGGVPPFRETRNYVSKVKNYQRDFGERIASMQVASAGAPNMVQ